MTTRSPTPSRPVTWAPPGSTSTAPNRRSRRGWRPPPRTVLAPHLGSATTTARVRMAELCIDAVCDVLAGREPPQPGARVTAPPRPDRHLERGRAGGGGAGAGRLRGRRHAGARDRSRRGRWVAACPIACVGCCSARPPSGGCARRSTPTRPTSRSAFDPFTTAALTTARDAVTNPAPVIGVVGELEPGRGWGETNADRVCAIDDHAAVALAEAGGRGRSDRGGRPGR
jgi:hypothetical protein